jgi:pyruvate formate lyase activating enzyme
MSSEKTAIVFNIQRYSVHDGSGIRTLVFIKGCPLRCEWCSNPESQKAVPQLSYVNDKCTGDDVCRRRPCCDACPCGAITATNKGKVIIDWERCDNCGKCAKACLWDALRIIGEEMTVEEVIKKVERDRIFFDQSGGGLTLGGGEPLTVPEFASELFKECKALGVNTALETCGYTQWESLETVIPYADLVYYDIKHMDAERHKNSTGVTNTLILENAKRILGIQVPTTVVRVPLIPKFNANEKQIKAISCFVKEAGGKMMELLPYHRYGKSKYRQIGRQYLLDDLNLLEEEQILRLRNIVLNMGLKEITGVI